MRLALRGKLLLKIGALLCGFALMGILSLWGFASLRANNRAAQAEFHELLEMRSIGVRLAADRALLAEGPATRPNLVADLRLVLSDLHRFISEQDTEVDDDDGPAEREHDARERLHANQAIALVNQILASLTSARPAEPNDVAHLSPLLVSALAELDAVAGECSTYLTRVHAQTRSTVRLAIAAMSILSVVMLLASVAVGVALYRSVVLPLRNLNDGVREIAAGHFTRRLPECGDPEFLAVIREFNRMAAQLEEFYLNLEEKVAQKSRELVRSERLASVGFLAAGVAHEIRNPLGIISGYAQLWLKTLAGARATQDSEKEKRILGVIRDEAFRCKEITEKLLGLVQGSAEGREVVDMGRVVRDMEFLLKGLPAFRERQPEFHTTVSGSLDVVANPMEMKQVVLNLTLNALEAVEAGTGRIDVEGRRIGGHVELSVRDNGCGITAEGLGQVFEPFYTSKRGKATPGTGLGLSISHAIIEGYGGIIRAESDGPGRGSRFTIELPAAREATV